MAALKHAPFFELQVIATGSHLSAHHGMTVQAIERDGFAIHQRVEVLTVEDSALAMAKALGNSVLGISDSLSALQPNLVILLGDRFEILGAAQAASLLNIPIAHLHGGEVTEGNIDESMRHAITKLSHLHFTANEVYRNRVIQLGEQPSRVFNVGAPGLDLVRTVQLKSADELKSELGLALHAKPLLVTFHPVTLVPEEGQKELTVLLEALSKVKDREIVFTAPNADAGGIWIRERLEQFVSRNDSQAFLFTSLGSLNYLSLMSNAAAVVGNSSSGIIEAPFLGVPTVNIGPRQKGRVRAPSVIDCIASHSEILSAISRAVTAPEGSPLRSRSLVHGDGHATEKIVKVLKAIDLSTLKIKPFYDLPSSHGNSDS